MKFALVVPNCGGDFADVRFVAQVAHEAEDAGWDGFFVWDHIGDKWAPEVSDPWVMLTALALATSHVKLGTLVTPLPRRQPWKLARELVTLDHISNGRMILGVGTGGGIEYVQYHVPGDGKAHAEMLDEGLAVLIKLWSGETVHHNGQYYQLTDVRHLPRPVQQPRIPIWVGGVWPNRPPMRRAARWDGVCPIGKGLGFLQQMSPEELQSCLQYTQSQRNLDPELAEQPFDTIHWGLLDGKDAGADAALALHYSAAGATWWVDNVTWERGSLHEQRARIRQGPPRL